MYRLPLFYGYYTTYEKTGGIIFYGAFLFSLICALGERRTCQAALPTLPLTCFFYLIFDLYDSTTPSPLLGCPHFGEVNAGHDRQVEQMCFPNENAALPRSTRTAGNTRAPSCEIARSRKAGNAGPGRSCRATACLKLFTAQAGAKGPYIIGRFQILKRPPPLFPFPCFLPAGQRPVPEGHYIRLVCATPYPSLTTYHLPLLPPK